MRFSAKPTAGTEDGDTQIVLTVTASEAVTGDQTVQLNLDGLTSTAAGADFNALTASTIKILDGQTTGFVTLTVKDDEIVEGSETANFFITSPSPGIVLSTVASETQAAVTITDNENLQVNLKLTTGATVSEAGITVITLTAEATQAVQGDQAFALNLSGSASTADFVAEGAGGLLPTSITIPNSQRKGIISFSVKDDALVEWLETATFTISQPTATPGIELGSVVSHSFDIVDNDFPVVSLDLSTATASEAGRTTITVKPTVSEAVRGTQSVELELTGAISAADFTGALPPSLTILDGATTGTPFTITVADDVLIEGLETGAFKLKNPSAGLTLDANPNYGLTIADNDFP
ncbi:MAG: calcium-binding protein, partial [Synechococcales cyanobacterium RU_4_20]|nr:calcium-binding protein [Synechococcales cyanobacterium RU_4_20]